MATSVTLADRRWDKSCLRDFTDIVIGVKVGQDQKIFNVHARLLRASSGFFDTALKQEWKEGQEGQVTLPDRNVDMFGRFVEWLYSRRIACKDGTQLGLSVLCKLYVLGETILAAEFQNDVINALVNTQRQNKKIASMEDVATIYNGTPVGSPARKLMVDHYTSFAKGTWFSLHLKNLHAEFLTDIVVTMADNRALPSDSEFESLFSGVPKRYYKDTSKKA